MLTFEGCVVVRSQRGVVCGVGGLICCLQCDLGMCAGCCACEVRLVCGALQAVH